jgi:hypothetical protein
MKNIDSLLKELGDLYEFNREIRRYSFKYPENAEHPEQVSENTAQYEVRDTQQ